MAQVSAIPSGQHTVTPHLVVKGAPEAIDFYVKAFGAVEKLRMPGPNGKLMHAELEIGDSRIYLAEEAPQWGSLSPKTLNGSPVVIHLYVENADAAFNRAVEAGATVNMPVSDMFWGDRFGKVTDPFGHQWTVAHHLEDLTPEEMNERGQAGMAAMSKNNS